MGWKESDCVSERLESPSSCAKVARLSESVDAGMALENFELGLNLASGS